MASEKRPSLKSPLFRGSFVHLAKPRVTENDDGSESSQYEITMAMPKTAPATKAFIADLTRMLQSSAEDKHGGKVKAVTLKHYPIKDGDEMADSNEDGKYDNFRDHWVITAKSNFKPDAIDINGDPLLTTDELYSGAWYKIQVSTWAWENKKGGRGVSINLEAVIKMKDDKRIGGGVKAADAFKDDIGTGETSNETEPTDEPTAKPGKRNLLG
jgi:hypothetical protein